MTQYDSYGLGVLRSYAYNNFNWLSIENGSGSELLRWDLLSNGNVTVDSDAASNPVQYTITVTGQDLIDAGNTLPVTMSDGVLYETDTSTDAIGSDPLRDTNGNATQATLEAANDEVEVTFEQRIPP